MATIAEVTHTHKPQESFKLIFFFLFRFFMRCNHGIEKGSNSLSVAAERLNSTELLCKRANHWIFHSNCHESSFFQRNIKGAARLELPKASFLQQSLRLPAEEAKHKLIFQLSKSSP